jgi:hypothetical protein
VPPSPRGVDGLASHLFAAEFQDADAKPGRPAVVADLELCNPNIAVTSHVLELVVDLRGITSAPFRSMVSMLPGVTRPQISGQATDEVELGLEVTATRSRSGRLCHYLDQEELPFQPGCLLP